MKLRIKELGEGEPLIILHGLLGMLDNWQTPAKTYAKHFHVYLADQRNHGRSPHSNEFSYKAMTDDLLELVFEHRLHDLNIIGHSMGGKVAMKFAQNNPQMVRKLVVADMGPRQYPVHHRQILDALLAVDFSKVSSRGDVEEVLKENNIRSFGVRQFLMKNLYWEKKGKLNWRFNLPVIDKNVEQMGEQVADSRFDGDTLFIRGELSDYITDDDQQEIKSLFPNAQFHTVKQAGHWLHADQPEAFLKATLDFLKE